MAAAAAAARAESEIFLASRRPESSARVSESTDLRARAALERCRPAIAYCTSASLLRKSVRVHVRTRARAPIRERVILSRARDDEPGMDSFSSYSAASSSDLLAEPRMGSMRNKIGREACQRSLDNCVYFGRSAGHETSSACRNDNPVSFQFCLQVT